MCDAQPKLQCASNIALVTFCKQSTSKMLNNIVTFENKHGADKKNDKGIPNIIHLYIM